MRIGVICPSEIAIRRFMPAMQKCGAASFAGVSVYSKEERLGSEGMSKAAFEAALSKERDKAAVFVDEYGGKIFDSYSEIASSSEVDALYIPLPPALHHKWAKFALEHGKHVLVEKPSTTLQEDSEELVHIAAERGLALNENYMFAFHDQLSAIDEIIRSGEIGEVRLYRVSFGFPRRPAGDFRYNKALGGGAMIDAGGYTLRYALKLLGDNARVCYAQLGFVDGYEVDMYGSGALTNDKGDAVQVAFGMDNAYKCELEVWGSKGCLTSGRVLTAPDGFVPNAIIKTADSEKTVDLPADDAFLKSIEHFVLCASNDDARLRAYNEITKQAELLGQFMSLSSFSDRTTISER